MRLAPHTAQAFRTPLAGRGLVRQRFAFVRGSAGGSWRATTPSCRTSPGRRRQRQTRWWMCQGCSSACSGLPAHQALAPLAPSRDTRSGLDPQECGPASRPSALPGTSSHAGSYGLASLRIFTHRRILTPAAFISRIGQPLPLLSRITPVNTQSSVAHSLEVFLLDPLPTLLADGVAGTIASASRRCGRPRPRRCVCSRHNGGTWSSL